MFLDTFNYLPVAALIDDKILCMHGGLSPELHSLDQIRDIARPTEIPENGSLLIINNKLDFQFKYSNP